MSHRNIFLLCACVAALILCFACAGISSLSIWASIEDKLNFFSASDGIALFNLLIDIVIGAFTVWGLFWAASQFAEQSVKPQLRLLPGFMREGTGGVEYIPVATTPARLPGYLISGNEKEGGNLEVGLFLENHKPKMAQNLQVVIEIDSQTPPCRVQPDSSYECRWNVIDGKKVIMQFDEGLVIHMGHGVHFGKLLLLWEQGPLPETCRLEYTIYKSEGKPDSGTCVFTVQWF